MPSPTLAERARPQARSAASGAPSPWGEGWGEGELRSRRFHGASSSGQVTLQTKGQFLAALDRRSAPLSDLNSYEARMKKDEG